MKGYCDVCGMDNVKIKEYGGRYHVVGVCNDCMKGNAPIDAQGRQTAFKAPLTTHNGGYVG